MNVPKIKTLGGGANQSGLRDYNERTLLSMLLRNGPTPGSELARHVGVSSQTVSVILRKLEKDGLVKKGTPTKGKVGKPSVPMGIAADGVFSFGLKIGRRRADLLIIDFSGEIKEQIKIRYDYPLPETIFKFLKQGIAKLSNKLNEKEQAKICGIGIAIPFELWHWHELVGADKEEILAWKEVDFSEQVASFSDLPVYTVNDATAACRAEHVFGNGKEFSDYAYFFIAAFVGGGIVLNNSVFEGNKGNAGALGSIRTTSPNGESLQLIDIASLHYLETRLEESDIDPEILWAEPQDWTLIDKQVDRWIGITAQELAKASLTVCSVIDFEAIMIDGALPLDVKQRLIERTQRYLANQDVRGLIRPIIKAGTIGNNAGAIGAASGPLFHQYLLNTNVGLSEL